MKNFTISCCFIVKNEEENLGKILEAVDKFADEIVVVDTGSTDKTIEIAKNFTDKVFDFEWKDDFAAARNFSFSKASCDYIMWLDADDYIFPKDIKKINELKVSGKEFDVAYFQYVSGFDKNFKPTFMFERERLVKRTGGFFWEGVVHEVITPHGKVIRENIKIYHFKSDKPRGDRNLRIYQKKVDRGEELSPRERFYYARELYYNALYEKAIDEFYKFLDDKYGWKENKIEACLNMSYCYQAVGEKENALDILFHSFCYDLPRAEILCEIGKIYFDMDSEKSIYYYELVSKCKCDTTTGGFVINNCYDFLPYLQLCVLYYKLGDIKKSYYYHKKAKKIKKDHPSVIYNDKLFQKINIKEK